MDKFHQYEDEQTNYIKKETIITTKIVEFVDYPQKHYKEGIPFPENRDHPTPFKKSFKPRWKQ